MYGVHDQIVKELGTAFPEDLLALTLPHLAKEADPAALEFVSGKEHFNDLLRGRRWYPDLVARVRSRSDPGKWALAHLEIEYAFRRSKIVRLRNYNHVLTVGTGLPVHTGVVYLHGGPPGKTWRKFEEESFGRVPCTFRYTSLGLSKAPAREYLRRPEPLAWALAVLMRPNGVGSRAELALACVQRVLAAGHLDELRRYKLLNFVHTYAKLDRTTAAEYEALLRIAENQEVREMMMTFADEMKAEGRREGVQEGIERLRDVVLDLMAQRFGDLSERSRRAVASIKSLDELADLAKKVLQVNSPEELKVG
jgi:hypothetical protein